MLCLIFLTSWICRVYFLSVNGLSRACHVYCLSVYGLSCLVFICLGFVVSRVCMSDVCDSNVPMFRYVPKSDQVCFMGVQL